MSEYSYQIDPRTVDLGGGYRLRLIEGCEEMGGGVFPLAAYADEHDDTEQQDIAAYADAYSEGEAWLSSRQLQEG